MVLGSCSLFVRRCWIPFWIYIYIYILYIYIYIYCLFICIKKYWCPLRVVIFAHCKRTLLSWLFSCLLSCVRCIFFFLCFCLLSSYLCIWFVFSNSSIISFFWHASLSHFICGSILECQSTWSCLGVLNLVVLELEMQTSGLQCNLALLGIARNMDAPLSIVHIQRKGDVITKGIYSKEQDRDDDMVVMTCSTKSKAFQWERMFNSCWEKS